VRSQTDPPVEVIVVDDASDAPGRRFLDDRSAGLVLIRFPDRRDPHGPGVLVCDGTGEGSGRTNVRILSVKEALADDPP
jgi:hypothetical protein